MFRTLIATFLSFVFFYQLAQAASVTITSPKPNTVLKMGEAVEIKWEIAEGSSFEKVSIALASGAAQALTIDRVIVANIDAKNGTYKWTIPKTLKPKSKYVIEIGPDSSDIAFAGYISIAKAPKSPSSSARPSSSAHSSANVHPSVHPSISIPGNTKPSASVPVLSKHPKSSAKPSSSAQETKKPSPTTTTKSPKPSLSPKKMCVAYPDENNQMTMSCREVPRPTEIAKPVQHGTLRRRDKFAKVKRST